MGIGCVIYRAAGHGITSSFCDRKLWDISIFLKSVQLIFSAHLQLFPYCGALHIVVSMFNVFIFSSFSSIHIFWRSQWWANMYFLYRSGTKHDKAVCDTDNWHSYCSNHKTATKIFRSAQVLGFNPFIQQVWYSNHMSIIVSIHATVLAIMLSVSVWSVQEVSAV